jgi:hypothetical protein
VAQARDWDQERRERRAQEHGRERVRIDREAEQELEAVAKLREQDQRDRFHDRVEPARALASEWRHLGGQERRARRDEYLGRVREAIDQAARAEKSEALCLEIRAYYENLARLFGGEKPASKRLRRRR